MQNIIAPFPAGDTISIDEAIVSQMIARGGFDETNSHIGMRAARRKIHKFLSTHRVEGADANTASSEQLPFEVIDDIIIMATRNGAVDLFDLKR